jgi:hypothetical protein
LGKGFVQQQAQHYPALLRCIPESTGGCNVDVDFP